MKNCQVQNSRSPPLSSRFRKTDFGNHSSIVFIIKEERIMSTSAETISITKAEAEKTLKDCLFLGACKTEDADKYLSKESICEGISKYLIIKMPSTESQKALVREKDSIKAYLRMLAWSEEKAWKIAEENTKRDTKIVSLTKILFDDGFDEEDFLYVVTNKYKWLGASSALNLDTLRSFAEEHNTREIVLLPSSIHEMLIVPHPDTSIPYDSFVNEVNHSEVEPEERLTDRAYTIRF